MLAIKRKPGELMTTDRLRFAPSPTGHLHIGGARTALFNWLLARKHQGTLVLRIEDTDVARSTRQSIDAILDAMEWLGLDYDEGPIYQTDRFDLYREYVAKMLREGTAYRCYCSSETLEAKREQALASGAKPKYDGTCRQLREADESRPHVVRFRAPRSGRTVFNDLIKGPVAFENAELDDLIIQRSDGTPTYNFVVVIDDATMGITTVIRGDDHVNNTPRQILLYEALGFPVPLFAHVPMILGADKTRLSKRHGATGVMAYRDMGILPEAMINYLVRLGWSHGDQEIFSRDELVQHFSIEQVGRSAGVFNPDKLVWLNGHYIRTGDPVRIAELLVPFLAAKGVAAPPGPYLHAVVKSLQERAKTLVEMADMALFYFRDGVELAADAAQRHEWGEMIPHAAMLAERLETLEAFDAENLERLFKWYCDEAGIKLGKVGPLVRRALTGAASSPGIFEVMAILGRERSVGRLRRAIQIITTAGVER